MVESHDQTTSFGSDDELIEGKILALRYERNQM